MRFLPSAAPGKSWFPLRATPRSSFQATRSALCSRISSPFSYRQNDFSFQDTNPVFSWPSGIGTQWAPSSLCCEIFGCDSPGFLFFYRVVAWKFFS